LLETAVSSASNIVRMFKVRK